MDNFESKRLEQVYSFKSLHPVRYFLFLHFEWIALLSGLVLMVLHNPYSSSASICIIDRMGFTFCPGCGLGASVAYLFRGEFLSSLQSHPLGLPAVIVIMARVITILIRNSRLTKTKDDEKNL